MTRFALDRPVPRALVDVALYAPAYVVPGLASLLTVPLLFGILGASEYGRWALLYAIAAGVPQVTTSWLEAGVVRFGHRAGGEPNRWRVATAVLGSIVVSAPLAIVVVPRAAAADIAAAMTFTAAISLYLLGIARLQSAMAFASVSVAASVRSILGLVLGVIGALLGGTAWASIAGLAVGYLIGEVAGLSSTRMARRSQATAAAIQHSALTDGPMDGGFDPVAPDQRRRYEVASALNAVSNYTLAVGDRFVLSALRPLSDVGVYTATYALVDLAGRFLPTIVIGVVRPRIFRAWDRGDRHGPGRLAVPVATAMTWLVALMALGLVGVSLAARLLPVSPPLAGPIAFGFACGVAANMLALLYSAAGRQGRLSGHTAIAAATNVALNIALIPSLGAVGAAVATAGAYAVLLLLNAAGLARSIHVGGRSALILLASLGSLAALSGPAAGFEVRVAVIAAAAMLVPVAAPVLRLARSLARQP